MTLSDWKTRLYANPFDESLRLVFADFLEEREGDIERAAILRRGCIPLWDEEQRAAIALGNCRFSPATWDKRFSRDIAARARGFVECDVCQGRGWIRKRINDGHPSFGGYGPVDCKECKATGKLDKPPDLTPKQFLWLWVLLRRYRRSVTDAAIRELAESRYEHAVKLLDIGWLKNKRLTKRNKALRDMRATLFDGA